MIVYVRAKKDRDAILHVFERFYGYVPDIRTLGGVRGDSLVRAIEDIPAEDYTLVLLGREDRKWVNEDLSTAWMKVEFFEKAKIRNGRQHQIYWLIERAKNRFLTDIAWDDTYVLGRRGFLNPKPGTDVFLAYWSLYRSVLSTLFGRDIGTPLVVHRGSTDTLFARDFPMGEVDRETLAVRDYGTKPWYTSIQDIFDRNKTHVEQKAEITVSRIKAVSEEYDVFLPFSGGKDSLTVYYLLKDANVDFTPIFVDTGAEFEESREIAEAIGAEIIEAPVAKRYRQMGEEYLRTRECTRDKITALYTYVKKNADNPLLINGDRIAESRQRSLRADFRRDVFPVFSPIHYWSYLDEQLYLFSKRAKINKLYEQGFYRIGCTFCPFMDKFERWVLATNQCSSYTP